MVKKYIDEKEFSDFKHNHSLMVQNLNHNMTDLSKSVRLISSTVTKFSKSTQTIEKKLITMCTEFNIVKKIVWWIFGIIGTVVIAAIIGVVKG